VAYLTNELPHLLAAASLVVSRAGAGALWEFANVGVVPVLIPLVNRRGDQIRNAKLFATRGAAVMLMDNEVSSENLLATINRLIDDRAQLELLKKELKSFITLDSLAIIADKVEEELDQKGEMAKPFAL
jgi:UDP-N-acetylglucosamine--N-acetylmuramyl-(pentapeptide) pyrophosphoryl-undecaprenol N-acetylglucosamine transferase